jgi:hypothetical protein
MIVKLALIILELSLHQSVVACYLTSRDTVAYASRLGAGTHSVVSQDVLFWPPCNCVYARLLQTTNAAKATSPISPASERKMTFPCGLAHIASHNSDNHEVL